MPLTLNVGLSKKIGQPDYGSLGASRNVQVELDGGIMAIGVSQRQTDRQPKGLQSRVELWPTTANGKNKNESRSLPARWPAASGFL